MDHGPLVDLDLLRVPHFDVFVALLVLAVSAAVDALTHVLGAFEQASLHAELLALDADLDSADGGFLEALVEACVSVPVERGIVGRRHAALRTLVGLARAVDCLGVTSAR